MPGDTLRGLLAWNGGANRAYPAGWFAPGAAQEPEPPAPAIECGAPMAPPADANEVGSTGESLAIETRRV